MSRTVEEEPLDFSRYHSIVILTGAGVSVASGISPFRGPGGLWNDPNVERFAHRDELENNPTGAWKFFGWLRETARKAQPNPAHQALVRLEKSLKPEQEFLLITQNVDGLHQKAGSRNMLEYHGSVLRTKCFDYECPLEPFEDTKTYSDEPFTCPVCGSILRPDLTFFGEMIHHDVEWTIKKALRECDLFISIGTSGTVWPASNFVMSAGLAGAMTIYMNLEAENVSHEFRRIIRGKAEEILPMLVK